MTIKRLKGTREVIQHCLPYIKGRAIDLGAGKAKYKEIVKTAATDYIALDAFSNENIDVVADITNTGLEGNSFDTVICTHVFEHIPRPWLATREISRLLKKEGICIITAPFIQTSHADPEDYFRYTVQGLESLFRDNGFEIVESGGYGRMFATFFDFIKMLWFNPYKKRKKGSWTIVINLEKLGYSLDRFVKNNIIYANSYVVARKK